MQDKRYLEKPFGQLRPSIGDLPAPLASGDSGNPSSSSSHLMGHDSTLKPLSWRNLCRNRWIVLAASSWMEASSGTSYMFGMYSQNFKTTLGYNQKMVDGVGMAKDIGGNVGITSGFVGDYCPCWVVLLIGAIQNAFGYGMLWLALTGRIPNPTFWQMCFYICIGTNGATFFNTAALVTSVRNFPSNRGPVVGLLKGYIGLSGAIFTQLYLALYAPDKDAFLLMASWLPSLVAFLVMPLIHPLPPIEEPGERKNLLLVLSAGISLAFYLLGASLLDEAFVMGNSVSLAVSIGALIILFIPAVIALKPGLEKTGGGGPDSLTTPLIRSEEGTENRSSMSALTGPLAKRRSTDAFPVGAPLGTDLAISSRLKMRPRPGQPHQVLAAPESEEPLMDEEKRANFISGERPYVGRPRRGEDHNLLQALVSLDFWLIYVSMTLASGSGLTAINNLGQIGRSLGYDQNAIGVFVSLMSIWNFLGRVGGGFISESFVRSKGIPRPLFMVVTQLAMAVGHLIFATAFPGSLYVASVIVGLTYGAQWGVMPAVASEVFGLRYFSTLYNWLTITNPTGSYLLSVCIAGYLYDIEAEKDQRAAPPTSLPPPPDESKALLCSGAHCFRVTFIIMACACVVASLASLTLTLLSRSYYAFEFNRRQQLSQRDNSKFSESQER